MPRYEYRDKKSSKFWSIERTADGYEVTYGATGTTGRSQSKSFATAEDAQKEYDKVVASKVKKGYVLAADEVGSSGPKAESESGVDDNDGRPKGVPKEAWRNDQREWELCEKDETGQMHGVAQWWRLDGTLCCRTEMVHGVAHGSFTRFHENGEVSREGTLAKGRIVGVETFHRSTQKTSEHFAVYSAGKRVWTAINDHTSGARSFLDRDGDPCDQQGKKFPKSELSEAGPDGPDRPDHWKAPPPSEYVSDWTPSSFETEKVDGVYFTDALRRRILPRRGGIATPIRPLPSVDVAWAALRQALWACDNGRLLHDRGKDADARSFLWTMNESSIESRTLSERIFDTKARVGSEEEDAFFVKKLFARYSGALLHGPFGDITFERAADFLAASLGLPEACYRALLGLQDELPYQRQGLFERLRELLVIADEPTYRTARTRILDGLRASSELANAKGYVGKTVSHLAWAATFLLPLQREPDRDAECLNEIALTACKGRGFGNDEVNAGGLASVDAAGLQRFIETNPKTRHEFFAGGGGRIYLASILDLEGANVAETFANMKPAKPFEDSAEYNGRWCFMLAHLEHPAPLRAMLKEHEAGYGWGVAGLALARSIDAARVDAFLNEEAPDLVETVALAEPLRLSEPSTEELVSVATPTAFVPAKVAPYHPLKSLIDVPVEIEWSAEEREESGPGTDPGWDGKELRALSTEEQDAYMAHREKWAIPTGGQALSYAPARFLERLVALGAAPDDYYYRYGGCFLRAGEVSLPLLGAMLETRLDDHIKWAQPFGAVEIARPILAAFTGKKHKSDARAWMLRHPRHGWVAAMSMAFAHRDKKKPSADDKKEIEAGERALRYLASLGKRDLILEDAKRVSLEEEVVTILDSDPLDKPKAKVPKLPKYAAASALPRLTKKGTTLSDEETKALLVRLAMSNVDEVHPGVSAAQRTLDPDTRAAFAWALFQAWLESGAAPKEAWAMQALGFLGGDEEARKLAALAKEWPGNKASARAQLALDALLSMGSDTALIQINLLSEKSKYPAFKAAAAERIGLLARMRGLSAEELQDRLSPRLGLDEEGALELDFGPRSFRIGFDETLSPVVRDEEGKLLKSLPKPAKSDDPAKAKAAKTKLSGLKKDAKAVASVLLSRLERALVSQRTIPSAIFSEHFAEHPLVSHLARRLLWQVTGSATCFRVAEDGTLADVEDDLFALEGGDVRLAHPLTLDGDELARWQSVFAEYEILQPFDQLTRETALFDESVVDALVGTTLAYGKLRQLTRGRWVPWTDSWISTYSMALAPTTDGGTSEVLLHFEPGYPPGGDETDDQRIEKLEVRPGTFADMTPVAFSELVRDLRLAQR